MSIKVFTRPNNSTNASQIGRSLGFQHTPADYSLRHNSWRGAIPPSHLRSVSRYPNLHRELDCNRTSTSTVREGPVLPSPVMEHNPIDIPVSFYRNDGIDRATDYLLRYCPDDWILSERYKDATTGDFPLAISGKPFIGESLESGMGREMEEEIGLSCPDLSKLHKILSNTTGKGVTTTIYCVHVSHLIPYQPHAGALIPHGADDKSNKVVVLIHGTRDEIQLAMASITHIRASTDVAIIGVVAIPLADTNRLAVSI